MTKVLIVLTSHDQLGNTGEKTGFWTEEFAAPYYKLIDAGVDVTLASPKGGQPPIDPKSNQPDYQTEATRRLDSDKSALGALAHTHKLDSVNADDYDAVFYPGGHGPLWDLSQDPNSIALIEHFIASHKPVAAVCHAPAVLLQAKTADGEPLVKGKTVSGFSNDEEAAVGLTEVVPFLLESEMDRLGANYTKVAPWHTLAVQDGLLITGQNPQSSVAVADELLSVLKN
ncbi:type 1 glutamine amidotransferase domain-containing protein [Rhodobacteraceae bacterium RKSG542]|uniref:type 1 glutamine amidotransferase domain-containing protein n=1 Tax=Pseudovibrio flavus TaxID=2529854 RepID=UPI0012BC6E4F|nr:type 1 glutamine amidotransferase domain-containing protein [Pseudovibrio flavus]MTI19086.1 type 1 glutamine amidotransferase domain-containing protein [Pseudovibrio flavus]